MGQTRFTDGTDATEEHPISGEYKVARDKYAPGKGYQTPGTPSEPNDVVKGMGKYNLKQMHDAIPPGMGADPEHKELKRHLSVPDHEEIPHEKMQAAMAGQHGPEAQQLAHSVNQKMEDGRAADMDDVFAGSRGQDNSKKPTPAQPQGPPPSSAPASRYDMGE